MIVEMKQDINKNEIQEKIRKRIKSLMEKKGLKQKDLVEKTGLSQVFLSYFLTGKRKAGIDTLEKIAQALGVSVGELLEEEKSKKEKSIEEIAWEMVELFLKKSGKEVDEKTKRKMYEFALHKLKQAEEDIEELIKLLGS